MKALMYHYIREGSEDLPYFRYLHIDDFRAQLDELSSQHNFVTKEQFISALETGQPIEDGIILTFDDGLKDHFTASQELARRGMWGVFYVATGPYHTKQLLDVHRIHMLIGAYGGTKILKYLKKNLDDTMLSHDHVKEFQTLTYARQHNDEATAQCKRILNYFISYDVRAKLLTRMMKEFFEDEAAVFRDFYLQQEDMKSMQDAGMLFGSHSVSHPVFSKLEKDEQHTEITHSFDDIKTMIGLQSIKTFCYPYGGFHSFTDETEAILAQEKCAFSFNVEQRNIDANDLIKRPQALPRYDCNQFAFGQASMGLTRPSDLEEGAKHG